MPNGYGLPKKGPAGGGDPGVCSPGNVLKFQNVNVGLSVIWLNFMHSKATSRHFLIGSKLCFSKDPDNNQQHLIGQPQPVCGCIFMKSERSMIYTNLLLV